ncbi:uncharacterized protein VDAG_00904 [Verticillium dahliae VdLs.17]|uniref:PA14 domain-containing protein n=1 Tax=Verticillium dahliae (strain VdLs.17 / ATCC MYA-4575 / FGSC 10137) TaxID=498257 RepID=G2WSY1_VERDV|nr:uncharacterized protein VDAG_00904 [Verticillium dahliae VdLs.17]EGY17222.1 hypothetical protein VDAG_00904 [Verticillium dahliae VdLs.17]
MKFSPSAVIGFLPALLVLAASFEESCGFESRLSVTETQNVKIISCTGNATFTHTTSIVRTLVFYAHSPHVLVHKGYDGVVPTTVTFAPAGTDPGTIIIYTPTTAPTDIQRQEKGSPSIPTISHHSTISDTKHSKSTADPGPSIKAVFTSPATDSSTPSDPWPPTESITSGSQTIIPSTKSAKLSSAQPSPTKPAELSTAKSAKLSSAKPSPTKPAELSTAKSTELSTAKLSSAKPSPTKPAELSTAKSAKLSTAKLSTAKSAKLSSAKSAKLSTAKLSSAKSAKLTYSSLNVGYFHTRQPLFTGITERIGIPPGTNPSTPFRIYDNAPSRLYQFTAVNHRAFLYAPVTGTYTVTVPVSDDITLVWLGDKAISTWTRANADLEQNYNTVTGPEDTVVFTIQLQAGTYTPFRLLWANAQGRLAFIAQVQAPDGRIIVDGDGSDSSYFVRFACDMSTPEYPPFGQDG